MYFKDKEQKVSFRITTKQLEFIDVLALKMGVKRSYVLRMILNSYMGGLDFNENEQTNFND